MSIELDNPKTTLEKVDAVGNFVAQMLIAHISKDDKRFHEAHKKASEILFDLIVQLQDDEQLPPAESTPATPK